MIPTTEARDRGLARSADGSRIAWSRYGDGDTTILFIPTWNIVDARVVGHQVAALELHATVIAYDPRGSGASDRPSRGYGFPLHAADALAVLDAAGSEQAALVTASRSADGSRIAWSRYGDGDTVVLFIPTWNIVDARVVGHQVAALELHATVIAYDPRGSGASDRPSHGYGFPLHAADALAVLDAAGADQAALVTASRSVNTALIVASEHPTRVSRMAVVAPYMKLDPAPAVAPPAGMEHPLRKDWPGFVDRFMRAVFTEPDSEGLIQEMIGIALQASPEVLITQEAELDWTVPAGLLSAVGCPTLIVHGEADVTMPLSLVTRIADEIPGARLELIAGGGHRPDIRSPDIVDPLLLEFLLAPGPA